MSLITDRHLTMNLFPVLWVCLAASLLIGAAPIVAVWAQANDMFPTKETALQRAKQLKCAGAFAMGKEWMPCKDFATYENAVSKES